MPVNIKIDNFEGPFDLLLHLLKKSQMDIYNIPIHNITSQYMEYLNKMKKMDLEITSEFIVMAATLMEIKSKQLLPKNNESDTEDEENDPQKELIRKLIEYKKYKKCAEYLSKLEGKQEFLFEKKAEVIETKNENNVDFLKNVTMVQLYNIYSELLNKFINKKNRNNVIPKAIHVDKYRIQDKMEELTDLIKVKKNMDFANVIKNCHNKMETIVTFLALLELIKTKTVKVYQIGTFTNIFMESVAAENGEE